jgi:hypothetical protein
MTRVDTKKILDKVLDMGRSPLHYVAVDFNTDPEAIFCSIYIHLNAPAHLEHGRDVCGYKDIFTQSADVQPALDFLDVWAEIFRKERELDETDGH